MRTLSGIVAVGGTMLVAGLASCSSSPPPPTAKAAKTVPTAAPVDRCPTLAERARRFAITPRTGHEDAAPPWCARALVEKTRAECPQAFNESDPPLEAALREPTMETRGPVIRTSSDGRWIVETTRAQARVWEASPEGLRLAAQLRRVDAATLAVTNDVPKPDVGRPSAIQPTLLAAGKTVLVNDTLIALDSGGALAEELRDPAPTGGPLLSPDGTRLQMCRNGKPLFVDALTGSIRNVSGDHTCAVAVAFTPDGIHAVVADAKQGPDGWNRSPWTLTPFVVDVATGAARSFPSATFRAAREGAFWRVYLPDDKPDRACLSYAPDEGRNIHIDGLDPGTDVCPWEIDSNLQITRKAPPPDPYSPAKLGLPGTRIAGAARPGGSTRWIVTAVPHEERRTESGGLAADFTVAEVSGAPPKVLRRLQISGNDLTRVFTNVLHVDSDLPGGMSFLTPDVAVVGVRPPLVLDLAKGALEFVQGERIGGRWAAAYDHSSLIDLVTKKRFPLAPDEAGWRAVKSFGAACPERAEDVP